MKLVFEKSAAGHTSAILPPCDVPGAALPENLRRERAPVLPELAEPEVSRHYTELSRRTFGVNRGFYPLGSCTMKYNPRINEEIASLPGFADIHPLQPSHTTEGCREALSLAERYLCELTGMDAMSFQPAAGAHGEFLGLLLLKSYHESRGDTARRKILVPDSAHGTNPASAAMAGFSVVSIPSYPDGGVDLDALSAALDGETAGLMLTNPNTGGVFDKNILRITEMVHRAGGLCYYDGANLNAIMGRTRPGDMGFDVMHLNLHKTFSTPHGGGGPGSGPVGCKEILRPFLPGSALMSGGAGRLQMRAFGGNFLVVVKALCYLLALGGEGLKEASEAAVLNANYLLKKLSGTFESAFGETCMHEFVLSLEKLKRETGVTALDFAKSLIDKGMHPPTMYFPLTVHEALMVEPTETESKQTLDEAAEAFLSLFRQASVSPEEMKDAPKTTVIGRPDEVAAARNPKLSYPQDRA